MLGAGEELAHRAVLLFGNKKEKQKLEKAEKIKEKERKRQQREQQSRAAQQPQQQQPHFQPLATSPYLRLHSLHLQLTERLAATAGRCCLLPLLRLTGQRADAASSSSSSPALPAPPTPPLFPPLRPPPRPFHTPHLSLARCRSALHLSLDANVAAVSQRAAPDLGMLALLKKRSRPLPLAPDASPQPPHSNSRQPRSVPQSSRSVASPASSTSLRPPSPTRPTHHSLAASPHSLSSSSPSAAAVAAKAAGPEPACVRPPMGSRPLLLLRLHTARIAVSHLALPPVRPPLPSYCSPRSRRSLQVAVRWQRRADHVCCGHAAAGEGEAAAGRRRQQ